MTYREIVAGCLVGSLPLVAAAAPTQVTNRPENAELSARVGNAPVTKLRLPGPPPKWAKMGMKSTTNWLLGRGFTNKQTLFQPGDHPLGDRSIYNPALTYNDKGELVILPRMEQTNPDGKTWTSRVGMATSADGGKTWRWEKHAGIGPSKRDSKQIRQYESAGAEDPRATWVKDTKEYIVPYTMVERRTDGKLVARVGIARGKDLRHLEKTGPAFADDVLPKNGIALGGPDMPMWSKAGSVLGKKILATDEGFLGKFPKDVADKIRGKKVFAMYFGDRTVHLAVSLDGKEWHPTPQPVLTATPGEKDGLMVEPGPPPFYDHEGNIHVFYNADGNKGPGYPGGYALFEAVYKANDPTTMISKRRDPILRVTRPEEKTGQVNSVVFTPGAAVNPKTGEMTFVSGMADSQTEMTTIKQSNNPKKRLYQPSPVDKD